MIPVRPLVLSCLIAITFAPVTVHAEGPFNKDRREDVRDHRENMRDRHENRADRHENRKDRRENHRDRHNGRSRLNR